MPVPFAEGKAGYDGVVGRDFQVGPCRANGVDFERSESANRCEKFVSDVTGFNGGQGA